MPKTTQNILLEDLYRTKTSSIISSSWDVSFTVTTPPQNKKGYVLIEPDNDSKREKMFYHDVIWNTIHVKWVNRTNPTDHVIWVNVQINDTALIFNHLFEQDATTFYCEKTGNLSLNVWGWPVLRWIETINITDTPITVINNVTNYVYYKSETNQILSSTSESSITTDRWIVVAEVIAASGIITSIRYRNHKFSIGNFISSIEETSISWRTHTYTITFTDGTTFEYDVLDGKSAYEVAVDEWFIGTEEQWLISIRWEKWVIWRWAFNIATAYIPYDLVSYQGTTYINIVASTWVLPTNPTNFEIFASRWDDWDVSYTDLSNAIDWVTTDFQNADLTLLPKPVIFPKSINYTFTGVEPAWASFPMNTSGGNRTFTLNLSLFPTTNGCFEFTFIKSTSDANTVTIDVGSGKTIDGSQTYILTTQNESVTIQIQSSTFAKVIATSNKPAVVVTRNTKSPITLWESVSAWDYLRLWDTSFLWTMNPSVAWNNTTYYQPNWIWYDNTYNKVWGKFTIENEGTLVWENIVLQLSKNNTPTWTLSLKLYSDQWITLIATATALESSIWAWNYGTTYYPISFSFPWLVLPAGTYYLILSVDRPNNTSSFSLWKNNNTSSNWYTISSTWVFTAAYTKDMTLSFTYPLESSTKFYKTSAANILKTKYRGYAESSWVLDDEINMITGPVDNSKTGLTAWTKMYLSDTDWAISSSTGTISVEIGTAISSTAIQMNTYSDYTVIPSSVILWSSNSSVSNTSLSYSKLKEIEIKVDWIYTIDFTLTHSPNGTYISYWRIFKNWISFWTERSSSSSTPATYSENLTFKKWDLVQIYAYWNNAWSTNSISNFWVKWLPILRDFIPVTII